MQNEKKVADKMSRRKLSRQLLSKSNFSGLKLSVSAAPGRTEQLPLDIPSIKTVLNFVLELYRELFLGVVKCNDPP